MLVVGSGVVMLVVGCALVVGCDGVVGLLVATGAVIDAKTPPEHSLKHIEQLCVSLYPAPTHALIRKNEVNACGRKKIQVNAEFTPFLMIAITKSCTHNRGPPVPSQAVPLRNLPWPQL